MLRLLPEHTNAHMPMTPPGPGARRSWARSACSSHEAFGPVGASTSWHGSVSCVGSNCSVKGSRSSLFALSRSRRPRLPTGLALASHHLRIGITSRCPTISAGACMVSAGPPRPLLTAGQQAQCPFLRIHLPAAGCVSVAPAGAMGWSFSPASRARDLLIVVGARNVVAAALGEASMRRPEDRGPSRPLLAPGGDHARGRRGSGDEVSWPHATGGGLPRKTATVDDGIT